MKESPLLLHVGVVVADQMTWPGVRAGGGGRPRISRNDKGERVH